MKRYLLFAIVLMQLCFSACNKNEDLTDQGNKPIETADAIYEVTFQGTWSSQSHPVEYPSGAHFSPLFVVSHAADYPLYSENQLASEGIRIMAETGATGILKGEVAADAKTFEIVTGAVISSTDNYTVVINVSEAYPRLSAVTMIAPSPDWYLGLKNIELLDSEMQWKDEITLELIAFDSGTDSGSTFTSSNSLTSPFVPIHRISTAPLAQEGSIDPALGHLIIKRIQ